MEVYSKALATIESTDDEDFGPNGGFRAILSTPSVDRDGDSLKRHEWVEPLQKSYPLDMDHGMTVADTIGSFEPYFVGDELWMKAYFAPDEKSQRVRTLVTPDPVTGVRHITSVSVAFMTDKTKKEGEPRRELLNAGVVAIPSNRDAVIQCSKSARAAVLVDQGIMSPEEAKAALLLTEGVENAIEAKADKKPYGDVEYADPGYQSDGVHRYPINTPEHVRAAWSYINQERDAAEYTPEQLGEIKGRIRAAAEKFGIKLSGKSAGVVIDVYPRIAEGAIKEIAGVLKAAGTVGGGGDSGALTQAIHDAAVHLGATCIQMVTDEDPTGADDGANKSADEVDTKSQKLELEVPDGIDLEQFKAALKEVLNPPQEESPAESPAEAAAASDEEPAPAEDAADNAADEPEVDPDKQANEMLLSLFALQTSNDKETTE